MRVITLGTFDILHTGHIKLLKYMDASGIEAYVGLNTDRFVKKYRGVSPIMNYKEREEAIKTVFPSFTILPNDQKDGTIKDILNKVKPIAILVGSDWLKKDYLTQVGLTTADMVKYGLKITVVPYTESISSTEIKRRIKNG